MTTVVDVTGNMTPSEKGNEMTVESPRFADGNNFKLDTRPPAAADLSVLAEAAAKSPKRPVSREVSLDLTRTEPLLPVGDGTLTGNEAAASKRPANGNDKKAAAKRPATGKAKKTPAASKRPSALQKRSTSKRTRKLPSKLRKSSSKKATPSTEDVAAMLVQVASGTNDAPVTKKKAPRKYKKRELTVADGDIIRGITMKRPGKWQAQFYYSGQSRYIGIFTSEEKAAYAYEIVRNTLKSDVPPSQDAKEAFASARQAAFDGVEEKFGEEKERVLF